MGGLEIIFSVAGLILASIAIYIAYKSYRAQKKKKIVKTSQEVILQKESSVSKKPKIDPVMQQSQGNFEKTTFHYVANNLGNEPVKLLSVKTKMWHQDSPENLIEPIEQNVNKYIPSHPGSIEVIIEISKSDVNQSFPDPEAKKSILIQPTFIVEDEDGRKFEFPAVKRSLF